MLEASKSRKEKDLWTTFFTNTADLSKLIQVTKCNICVSDKKLIPHQSSIMQTIAYFIVTCPSSTPIIRGGLQCNFVINNACRVQLCQQTEGLTEWVRGCLSGECHTDQSLSLAVSVSRREEYYLYLLISLACIPNKSILHVAPRCVM